MRLCIPSFTHPYPSRPTSTILSLLKLSTISLPSTVLNTIHNIPTKRIKRRVIPYIRHPSLRSQKTNSFFSMADTSGSTDESRNRVPTPNNYEPDSHIPVTDGNTDVAQTLDGERMKVQAPGRLPMQRVYLLKGSANGRKSEQGLTNIPYDKKEDGPVMNPVGSLPSTQELVPGSHVVQYLEVGIVIGDDPSRFKPVRPLTNKKNKEGRKQRGDMPRHTSAIRAFIHISPTERSQAKCVVGVKPKDGYLNPRVIDSDCIFFYPEYWVGIEKGPKVTRRALMHARVKQLATNAEAQAERADATTTADKIAIPELLQGVKSFFDFDTELGLEDAESVARELKVRRRKIHLRLLLGRNQADTHSRSPLLLSWTLSKPRTVL